MSLLEEIRADGPARVADLEGSLRELCAALLAENHLRAASVVAARIRVPRACAFPTAAARELGLHGIPVFWEHGDDDRSLRVVAHVRLKRRRRLRAVALPPEETPLESASPGSSSPAPGDAP